MKQFIPLLFLCTLLQAKAQPSTNQLKFDPTQFVSKTFELNGKTIAVRAYEKVIYVANPVDTAYEVMNIYIPEAYFNKQNINGFQASNAPIFFPNQIGGYMPSKPGSLIQKQFEMGGAPGHQPLDGMQPPTNGGPGIPMKKQSAIQFALTKGYIVASAGTRGRTLQDANGKYTGKAPAAIVDLKAAIRYLKFNDKVMPGDANKIISNGTSAGGAISALLGATGNNPDYEPYLKELGAANATDEVFAVSAYCPITNLDNADIAYEWQFNGVTHYTQRNGFQMPAPSTSTKPDSLTKQQIELSNLLKALFPNYVNSLQLKDSNGQLLSLDKMGDGSFKEWVKSFVIASAQKAMNEGVDLSKLTWIKQSDHKIKNIDFEAYVHYMERMKTPFPFDAIDLSTGENQLFGTSNVDKQHFTSFSAQNSTINATMADAIIVKMMNPMNYIGTPQTKTTQHWRIRHGTKDKDTGLAISVILATYLENKGFDVDFALPWDVPHSGDYDLDELFQWIDNTVKQ